MGDVWLRVRSQSNGNADVIAITPWGGFAADRYWKMDLPQDNGERWAVNPIEFFRAALKVRPRHPGARRHHRKRPAPADHPCGRRRLSQPRRVPGTPLASEVMLKEFLERYRWPSTVSIIEGEVGARGLYAA
jgi:hypothetical protein